LQVRAKWYDGGRGDYDASPRLAGGAWNVRNNATHQKTPLNQPQELDRLRDGTGGTELTQLPVQGRSCQ